MKFFIEDKLFLRFVEKYGKEKADMIDSAVTDMNIFPFEKIKEKLDVDRNEVVKIYYQIQDAREQEILQTLKKIMNAGNFDGSDIASLKYISFYSYRVFCYFALKQNVIKKIKKNQCEILDRYEILKKRKFMFLARLILLEDTSVIFR